MSDRRGNNHPPVHTERLSRLSRSYIHSLIFTLPEVDEACRKSAQQQKNKTRSRSWPYTQDNTTLLDQAYRPRQNEILPDNRLDQLRRILPHVEHALAGPDRSTRGMLLDTRHNGPDRFPRPVRAAGYERTLRPCRQSRQYRGNPPDQGAQSVTARRCYRSLASKATEVVSTDNTSAAGHACHDPARQAATGSGPAQEELQAPIPEYFRPFIQRPIATALLIGRISGRRDRYPQCRWRRLRVSTIDAYGTRSPQRR